MADSIASQPGPPGPAGPPGPPGAAGITSGGQGRYVFDGTTQYSTNTIINHGLGRDPVAVLVTPLISAYIPPYPVVPYALFHDATRITVQGWCLTGIPPNATIVLFTWAVI